MKPALIHLTAILALASCNPPGEEESARPQHTPPTPSHELAANFPLLPVIEKTLWAELLAAEAQQATAPGSATPEVERIAALLRSRHPFTTDGQSITLGGITYHRTTKRLRIPAKVEFPNASDDRHPNEVELLLCTPLGRLHETLFVAEVRPLHLELLLHLAGHPKGTRFRIEAITEDGTRTPVESLIRPIDGGTLDGPLPWEFSGSDFQDLYSPDLSGDLAIFWHVHDSVLRVAHEGIATGEVKLKPAPHPPLKNGSPVTLELIPHDN